MRTTRYVDAGNLATDLQETTRPLRVVIAYDGLAAGKRAMRVMTSLAKRLGDGLEFEPLPWSFDLLADVDWREVAASEVVKADILIIATSDINPLPPAVGRWAETAMRRKQGTAAAVVALFGPEGSPDPDGSARLEAIKTAAHGAGLDFFAPSPYLEIDEAIARIHRRAEMITPVLEEIIEGHISLPSVPHSASRP